MATSTLQLTITNTGGGTLTFSISVGNAWLSVDVSSGSTNAGSTGQIVNVTANTAGLTVGNYSGNITITSNGGNVTIPVSMVVVAASSGGASPHISASASSISISAYQS